MRSYVIILSIFLTAVSCGDARKSKRALPPLAVQKFDHASVLIANLPVGDTEGSVNIEVKNYIDELASMTFSAETKFGKGKWLFPVDSKRAELAVNEKWLKNFKALLTQEGSQKVKDELEYMVEYLERELKFQKLSYGLNNRALVADFLAPYYEISSIGPNPEPELLETIAGNLRRGRGFYDDYAAYLSRIVKNGKTLHSRQWEQFGPLFEKTYITEYFTELSTARPELAALIKEVRKDLDRFFITTKDVLPQLKSGLVRDGTKSNVTHYKAALSRNGIEISPLALIALGEKGLRESQFAMRLLKWRILEEGGSQELINETYKDEKDFRESISRVTKHVAIEIQSKNLVTIPAEPIREFYNKDDVLGLGAYAVFPSVYPEHEGFPTIIIPDYNLSRAQESYFLTKGSTHSIMAHEGRPGHELHFTLLRRSNSLIKKKFALNTAFVEGWGLYSEHLASKLLGSGLADLVSSYYHANSMALRAARAILDSKLNIGLMNRTTAIRFLQSEVESSKGYATAEVDRYLNDPGRDGSYYYGYLKFLQEKELFKTRLGNQYSEKCYNDSILQIGGTYFTRLNDELEKVKKCQ
ncbi:MAG TPA: DUF885 family protein [Bacteriovoracaceae bacterium]|nr:DUF885 family protein [Bacteriovoracaceae bacterium]